MKIDKKLENRIQKAVSETVDIVPYNFKWLKMFEEEKKFLLSGFPLIIKRVEHFGSTSIPGISAKPVIDILVEVTSYKDVRSNIVPKLVSLGYEYFWRPEIDKPPMYAWFIKRNLKGKRTHHLHMVLKTSKLWERIYFRDYLIRYPVIASQYEKLKIGLSKKYPNDREAYTKGKTEFVSRITKEANLQGMLK